MRGVDVADLGAEGVEGGRSAHQLNTAGATIGDEEDEGLFVDSVGVDGHGGLASDAVDDEVDGVFAFADGKNGGEGGPEPLSQKTTYKGVGSDVVIVSGSRGRCKGGRGRGGGAGVELG